MISQADLEPQGWLPLGCERLPEAGLAVLAVAATTMIPARLLLLSDCKRLHRLGLTS